MTRRPPRGPLRRRITDTQAKRQLLVITEGRVTEPGYVTRWARRRRRDVVVVLDGDGGPPLQLVQRAIKRRDGDARDSRRGEGRPFDEVWCVFDVDDHPELPRAIDLARRHGIRLAVSNPCIELWFVLHFEDQTAYVERGAVQARSRRLLGCEKALDDRAFSDLEERIDDARRRAQELDAKHELDGSRPGSNPSSGVWKLVESMKRRS